MNSHKTLSLIITVTSLTLLLVRSIWPSFFNIDAIGLGLIVLAALPWFAPLIKSIELPGVGKIELQEFKKRVDDAKGAASSASLKAEFAMINASTSNQKTLKDSPTTDIQIGSLIDEYNCIRNTQPSGPARTSLMTSVVSKMISLAEHLEVFNVKDALSDLENAGRRLAAYSWLYSKPNPEFFSELICCLTMIQNKPFGQYWAIQALGKIIALKPESTFSMDDVKAIKSFYDGLPAESDRHYELGRIISSIQLPMDTFQRIDADIKNRIGSGRWEKASHWNKSAKSS